MQRGAGYLAIVIDLFYEMTRPAEDAAQCIRVPAQKLGGAVDHQVRSQFEWFLIDGRRKGVVHDDQSADGMRGREARRARSTTFRVGLVGLSR